MNCIQPCAPARRDVEVAAVVGLDLVDRRQDLPRHAVLDPRRLVDRQQKRRDREVADEEVRDLRRRRGRQRAGRPARPRRRPPRPCRRSSSSPSRRRRRRSRVRRPGVVSRGGGGTRTVGRSGGSDELRQRVAREVQRAADGRGVEARRRAVGGGRRCAGAGDGARPRRGGRAPARGRVAASGVGRRRRRGGRSRAPGPRPPLASGCGHADDSDAEREDRGESPRVATGRCWGLDQGSSHRVGGRGTTPSRRRTVPDFAAAPCQIACPHRRTAPPAPASPRARAPSLRRMHPTEHRGLRELYAMARQLRNHWRALAERIDAVAPQEAQLLRAGADVAGALLGELADVTAARGLYGKPMAQGLGARLAGAHSTLLDTTLEVNQALRFAVLDVVHVVTLLDYLARAAAQDGDAELQRFLERCGAADARAGGRRPRRRGRARRRARPRRARLRAGPRRPRRPRRRAARWARSASGSTAARGAERATASRLSGRARRPCPPPSGRARSCACRTSP